MEQARWAIDIDRDAIATAKIVGDAEGPLRDGEVEVRLDCYSMTANNVTYAALGKPVGLFANGKGYWDFFSSRRRRWSASRLGLRHRDAERRRRGRGG